MHSPRQSSACQNSRGGNVAATEPTWCIRFTGMAPNASAAQKTGDRLLSQETDFCPEAVSRTAGEVTDF